MLFEVSEELVSIINREADINYHYIEMYYKKYDDIIKSGYKVNLYWLPQHGK